MGKVESPKVYTLLSGIIKLIAPFKVSNPLINRNADNTDFSSFKGYFFEKVMVTCKESLGQYNLFQEIVSIKQPQYLSGKWESVLKKIIPTLYSRHSALENS